MKPLKNSKKSPATERPTLSSLTALSPSEIQWLRNIKKEQIEYFRKRSKERKNC